MGAFFIFAWCYGMPKLAQTYWPLMIDFLTKSPWGWSFETMYVLFSVFQHIGIILACQAMWWVLYHFEIPFFEQYKSVENWPWQVDAPGWRKLVYKSIFVAVFGGLYGIPLLLAPYWFKVMPIAFPLEVEKLPTPTNFFLTLVFCIMVEDFFFQIMHRIFHTKWLYNNVHKIHHEHTRVLSIGSVYAHPIEFMFGDLLPVSMGPIILDSHIHMFTVFAWFAFLHRCWLPHLSSLWKRRKLFYLVFCLGHRPRI